MAGHSHWANIQRNKSKVDAKRGKVFSKWAKLIMSAARTGGSDLGMNLPLRYAVDRAKADNMPKDSIDRAIKKGAGELDGSVMEEVVYEAYVPGGVAIIIEALTDNRNRTAPNIRMVLTKRGGTMASSGSVAFMFKRRALFAIVRAGIPEDEMIEVALENGADDVTTDQEEIFGVDGPPEEFMNLATAFADKGWETMDGGLCYVPDNYIPVDAEAADKLQIIVDLLEDDEDVQAVHHNAEFPE
ncbi:MAG: YebC/PmpR family DNA-binding transcriptional regulator [Planctomycetota bacterium]|nr:YebC/PmpR family DNA-binding transcriptional regulator [Planctomycetota bacterium]MDA1114636.1 YebC/PmpR family DNA-binding transcriptional regulator [Planctomycetota bacterium]